jgi:hypothetical protein
MPQRYYVNQFNLASKPETKHLFLAEGETEVGLLEILLDNANAAVNTMTILCFKGLGKVSGHSRTHAKLLEKEPGGLNRLRGIGLLADSEAAPSNQIDRTIECAKALGFANCAKDLRERFQHDDNGRAFRFFLFPAPNLAGRIEALVLQEITNEPIFACLSGAFACIAEENNQLVDQKAQVQMYISAKANTNIAGVGRAFEAGIFNAGAPPYNPVREMVEYILSKI